MKPQDKLKQLMAKLVELPPTDDKLDLAIDFCSNGEFPTAQSVSDAIIADIQSASSPKRFLWDSCNIDLENEDVGSIVGYDASGGPVLDKYDIVPEGDVSELVVPPSTEVINGLTVTYPPYSSLNPSGQFIMKCMSKWWLKGAFDLVEQAYGLKFDSNSFVTTMPIQLDDVPPSGGAIVMAYVNSTYDTTTFKTVSMYCAVNTNPAAYGDMDLTNPNGQANSAAGSSMFLDRVLCHELVHGVMSANISGFNAKLPKYFTEGTAELIAGADDTRKNELLATAGSVSMFQAGLDDNATDTLRWYTTGYIWLRWYIKHTSRKGVDLSFDHLLPDIEVLEYKVSNGVAFEYGRANNKRFDLIGDEAIDFYTRDHIGLNKWDLCTSPKYLNSKYGSTIRIPFDDAIERNDIDYIDLLCACGVPGFVNVCGMLSFNVKTLTNSYYAFGIDLNSSNFLASCANSRVTTAYSGDSIGLFRTYNNQHEYDWNRLTQTKHDITVTDISRIVPEFYYQKSIYVILLGKLDLVAFFSKYVYYDTVPSLQNALAGLNAILGLDSDNGAIKWNTHITFLDYSGIDPLDALSGNISNDQYVNQLTYVSPDNLEMIYYLTDDTGVVNKRRNIFRFTYVDCRHKVLEAFPTISDFCANAVRYNNFSYNGINYDYPNTASFTEKFADIIEYEVPILLPAEYTEITINSLYTLGFVYNHSATDLNETFYGEPKLQFTNSYSSWGSLTEAALTKSSSEVISDLNDDLDSFMSAFSAGTTVMLAGFEILCAIGVNENDVSNLILSIVEKYKKKSITVVYAFIVSPLCSETLYKCYKKIKSSIGNICVYDNYVCLGDSYDEAKYIRLCTYLYMGTREYTFSYILDWLHTNSSDKWLANESELKRLFYTEPAVNSEFKIGNNHISNTKSPCYYTSFTQLPFSDRFNTIKTVEGGTQAYDGVSADILDVNLHTVYDPLSPSYYQGGGTCKQVYDFEIDPITNKSMLGLINYHKEGDNVPNVDGNYSYPVYGSGCPWIVYTEKEKSSYDSVYFYLTRDNYSGTITYQLTSNIYPNLKPIFQTIVFGSPDTDNYTSKYPLYVGGGANYVAHTEYSYTYQPPGKPPPPAVTVHVEGNKYSLNLTGTKTSNISPIYPSAEPDSGVTNFAFRGLDGDWKYLASFDGSISNDDILFAHKLADPYYWGIISPYVGSDVDYSYIYDINNDITNIYKPVRIINPYRELKEESGFGAISLSNLYAKCSDNKFGIMKVMTSDYESKSIFDVEYMQSIAISSTPVMNIVGTYTAYGGDTTFDGIEQSSIVLTDHYDEFDKIDVVFTDDSGSNRYVVTWHKHALVNAIKNSRDIDFDLTRGVVHNLYWNINISGCTEKILWGLDENCGIIDIIGYKRKYSRYLVLPNSCVNKEFVVEDVDGIVNTYALNNVLCIYLGEG